MGIGLESVISEFIDSWNACLTAIRWIYNSTYDDCPNRRVAHLMKYGKKARVRNKNFIRANKILNK
jgi:hypothetical protein